MHRILLRALTPPSPDDLVKVDGAEASHALRVKRLRPGESVQILDGAGTVVRGEVAPESTSRTLHVRVSSVERLPPPSPTLEVLSAVPKGGRVETMVEMLSQLGVARVRPLLTERSVVDPRPAKLERLRRVAEESAKQCGRAWVMEIAPQLRLQEALDPTNGPILIAHATGDTLPNAASRADRLRLLIGPEGGWTPEELNLARDAGATIIRLGRHTMRIETAAVAGAALLLANSHHKQEPRP